MHSSAVQILPHEAVHQLSVAALCVLELENEPQGPNHRSLLPAFHICALQTQPHASFTQEGETKILIDRSLADVYNATWTLDGSGTLKSLWANGGAFLQFMWGL